MPLLRVHALFSRFSVFHWFLRERIRIMHKWQNAQKNERIQHQTQDRNILKGAQSYGKTQAADSVRRRIQ